MCGIVSAVGQPNVASFLVDGLKRLEYRGYDSAGIAVLSTAGASKRLRAAGKFSELEKLQPEALSGDTGIGHTRWATHGPANERNAHPHRAGRVLVVHNGIIENFHSLREELAATGCSFYSDTDTEVIAALIDHYLLQSGSARQAVTRAVNRLHGAFALAIMIDGEPESVFGARRGAPLLVGTSGAAGYLASDALALSGYADYLYYLEDGDMAEVRRGEVSIFDSKGAAQDRERHPAPTSSTRIDKGAYPHFMLKEIHEQPEVIAHTLGAYLDPVTQTLRPRDDLDMTGAARLIIVACGTAAYAGRVAKYWIEPLGKLPVDVELASEFRYRAPYLGPDDIALFISQSGETADTLEALKQCKRAGIRTIALVNTPQSSIAREADIVLPTLAGPEIGVASTKAFTCQLAALAALSIIIGRQRGSIDADGEAEHVGALLELPGLVSDSVQAEDEVKRIASEIASRSTVLFLGRSELFPIALEGALKLKEISYIHAEGYAAGELKHGPIALIEPGVTVIVITPFNPLFTKTRSSIEQVLARGGDVIAVTDAKGAELLELDESKIIQCPAGNMFGAVLAGTVAVQLIAYFVSVEKGTDVDQPRNLAKSVTVE